MWQLKIKQKKNCGTYSTDEVVFFESEDVTDLTRLIDTLVGFGPKEDTNYTIMKKEEEIDE